MFTTDFRSEYKADYMAEVGLRSDEEKKWEGQGLTGPAVQVLADLNATRRAGQRENAAIHAAAVWVDEHVPNIEDEWVYLAHIQAILRVDKITVGGHSPRPRHGDNEAGRSARFPAFAECGKGRRYAADGPSWTAAIAAAAWRLQQEKKVSFAAFRSNGSTLSVVVWVEAKQRIVAIDGLFPPAWQCAVAAASLAAWARSDDPDTQPLLLWGAFYNVAVARFLAAEGAEAATSE